ncbi:hypothetical protein FVE85_8366 [Porphyridium purpureum]|uniref:Uncharacterized protein n=1 Tax=Porphyridium purpureum TaxID=35688 RepID=A0A5J4YMI9_PORPP|nr:hypothetical protein FVE85_8366 [Porphyridium purpureum]|eukprot:POR9163..scf244_11
MLLSRIACRATKVMGPSSRRNIEMIRVSTDANFDTILFEGAGLASTGAVCGHMEADSFAVLDNHSCIPSHCAGSGLLHTSCIRHGLFTTWRQDIPMAGGGADGTSAASAGRLVVRRLRTSSDRSFRAAQQPPRDKHTRARRCTCALNRGARREP